MKNQKEKPARKSRFRRFLLRLTGLVLLIVLLAVFLLPAIVSSSPVRRFILNRINSSGEGTADFADLKMGWMKGVRLSEISFNDKTGGIAVDVAEFSTRPQYASLLGGKISLGRTVVDRPRVQIDLRKLPLERAGTEARPSGKAPMSGALPITNLDLVVNDGNFKVTDRKSATTEIDAINSEVNLRAGGAQTRFALAMAVPDGEQPATVTAQGAVEPDAEKGFSLAGVDGTLTAEVKDLKLESLGPLLALAGVKVDAKGQVSGQVSSKITDGEVEDLTGNIKGKGLDVAAEQLKGDRIRTDKLDVDVKLASRDGMVSIQKLDLASDFVNASATGSVPTNLKSLDAFMGADSGMSIKGSFDCDVAAVTAQLPKTLSIKEGMRISSGKLAGDIETTIVGGERKIVATAGLTDLAGLLDDKELSLDEAISVKAQIASSGETTRLDEIRMTSSFASVAASGTLEEINYDAQADLRELQSQAGQFVDFGSYSLGGRLAGKGRITISEDTIDQAGAWAAQGLAFGAKEGVDPVKFDSDVIVALNASVDRKKSLVNIGHFTIESELVNVETKGALIPYGENTTDAMSVHVAARGADLAKVQPFVAQFAELPEGWAMAGVAQAEITVAAITDGYSIKTTDTVVRDLKVTSPDTEPFIQPEVAVVLDGEVYPKLGAYNLKNLLVQSDQLKVEASLSKKAAADNKTDLKGNATADFEWADAGVLVRPLLPEGFELAGRRTTAINFASVYEPDQEGQMLANLDAQAQFGFDKASYMGLYIDKVDTDIKVEKGVLKLAPFSTTVNNGTAGFAAMIDMSKEPRMLELPKPMSVVKGVQVNPETTQKLLMYVNPVFADVTAISGTASFDCRKMSIPLAKAGVEQLELAGTIAMDDINIRSAGFLSKLLSLSSGASRGAFLTVHPTEFTVSNGIMRYADKMQIDVGDNPFDFRGGIDIKNNRYMKDFTVVTPWTTDGRTVRAGREYSGNRIGIPVTGTVNKPEINAQDFVRQQAVEQGLKLLRDLLK